MRSRVVKDLPGPQLDLRSAYFYPAEKPVVGLILFKGDPGSSEPERQVLEA